jgi:hypothetical protein
MRTSRTQSARGQLVCWPAGHRPVKGWPWLQFQAAGLVVSGTAYAGSCLNHDASKISGVSVAKGSKLPTSAIVLAAVCNVWSLAPQYAAWSRQVRRVSLVGNPATSVLSMTVSLQWLCTLIDANKHYWYYFACANQVEMPISVFRDAFQHHMIGMSRALRPQRVGSIILARRPKNVLAGCQSASQPVRISARQSQSAIC